MIPSTSWNPNHDTVEDLRLLVRQHRGRPARIVHLEPNGVETVRFGKIRFEPSDSSVGDIVLSSKGDEDEFRNYTLVWNNAIRQGLLEVTILHG